GGNRLRAEKEGGALWGGRTRPPPRAAVGAKGGAARSGGFQTLLVEISGRAHADYTHAPQPPPPGASAAPALAPPGGRLAVALSAQPAFDPLAVTLALAHDAGLQVHAWINVSLVAGANELPSSRDHVIYRHPEWLMVPRALAEDFQTIDPRSPQYLGRLARYVRGQTNELEGLYISPASDAAIEYTTAIVRNIVARYAVDGVHFDYLRYPTDDFDFSRDALSAYRRALLRDLSPTDARRYEARLVAEPLIYTHAFPDRWRAFRIARMTMFMQRLHETVKATRPDAIVSAAVAPDAAEAV